jgi:hypothetical protein
MDPIEIFQHNGKTVEIHHDPDAESPREWGPLGKLVLPRVPRGWREIDEGEGSGRVVASLPVYMLSHSGVAVSTSPFGCPWDSWQAGYISIYRDDLLKAYGKKRMSPKLRQQAIEILKSEVKTYSQYLSGDVYGYVVGEESCWGFYGIEAAREAAKEVAH